MNLWEGDTLPDWYNTYVEWLLELLRPLAVRDVVEIGVRTGYGAQLFYEAWGSDIMYWGYDCELGTPEEHWFGQTLIESMGGAYCVLDTQTVNSLDVTADFVHVDAAHDVEGTKHDIELAVKCQPCWILVDDMDNPNVAEGVRLTGLRYTEYEIEGTPRRVALITL